IYTRRKGKSAARRARCSFIEIWYVSIATSNQTTLHQHNKVFKELSNLSSSIIMSIFENEIIEILRDKDYLLYIFDTLTSNDCQFMKCVNRHILLPDGAAAIMALR
uniref:Uncharacterized protein n=1 Tax=Amphimedon queenslandica TaxID=400682 RepID=A0A1X7U7I3_AMPQE